MRSRWNVVAIAGLLVAGVVVPAQAATNLVLNGDFEQTTLTSSHEFVTGQVANWSNATTGGYTGVGYNFLIMGGGADTTGFTSNENNHDYLWGPGNGVGSSNYSNNGLTSYSPTGGNYILADGGEGFRGAISQVINGLTIGQAYTLTFDWAAGQFAGYTGDTTEQWAVTFGDSTLSTDLVQQVSHGATAWREQTMNFTASSASQTLSFLAVGTPTGLPPTLLLDGVSLTSSVPEPASWAMFIGGFGLIGSTLRRHRRSIAALG